MLLAQIMIPAASAAAVLFAIWLAYDVLKRDKGTAAMQEIAGTILEGANAFLSRQYRTIGILALVTSVVVGAVVGIFKESTEVGLLTGAAFIAGALHRHAGTRRARAKRRPIAGRYVDLEAAGPPRRVPGRRGHLVSLACLWDVQGASGLSRLPDARTAPWPDHQSLFQRR